jgi:DNA-binding LytR/AlgR family response regulator
MKVLVVDDEPLARERLVRMLGEKCAAEAENAAIALETIARLEPDVVLLDIEMPGMNGLELAGMPGMPPVIFTTAHLSFAADAFDLDAIDFLPKPVRAERLERALERARRRAPSRAPVRMLAVHDAGTIRFVDPHEVIVFRARDKYTELVVDGRELLLRESLDTLEERLGNAFVRVHRSALVRCDAIRALAPGKAILADGSDVEVSRRAARRVEEAARRTA